MKEILLIQLISLFSINWFSQGGIISTGDETESKVFMIGNTMPKYDLVFQDGLAITNSLYDFSNRVNENGRLDYYSPHKTVKSGKASRNTSGNYYSLGLGVGNSYG